MAVTKTTAKPVAPKKTEVKKEAVKVEKKTNATKTAVKAETKVVKTPAAKPVAKPAAGKTPVASATPPLKKGEVPVKSAAAKPASVEKPTAKKVPEKVAKPGVVRHAPQNSPSLSGACASVEGVARAQASDGVVKKSASKPAKGKEEKGNLPYVSDGEIKVELIKSTVGCTERQIRTVQALGLKKINDTHVHKDNPAIRGMCTLVAHLVKVEKI